MKKMLIIPTLLLALCFTSCKKESADISNANDVNKEWTDAASRAFSSCGIWQIAVYTPNGTDVTASYSGYQFTFCPDNIITATNDIFSVTGNWYLLWGRGGDSFFEIDFKSNDQSGRMEEFDGMWVIKGFTEDKITLDSQDGKTRLVFVLKSK